MTKTTDVKQARIDCIDALQGFFWDWSINGYPPVSGWNAFIQARIELGYHKRELKEDVYGEIELLEFAVKGLMSDEEQKEWEADN